MNNPGSSLWPTLKRYDHDHLLRIGLPLGGIGTGTVSLGGRGDQKALRHPIPFLLSTPTKKAQKQ
jgi:hypothetical protein